LANIIYTKFFERLTTGNLDFDDAGTVVRCMLERSTSSYSPNKDHDFVSDLTSIVEVSVTSYARVTVGSKAVNIDDANDRVELDCADISFGALESGQTVEAIILYLQTGGDDSSATDDPLICYIDTATGLPAVLGGGTFTITIDSEGLIQFAQA